MNTRERIAAAICPHWQGKGRTCTQHLREADAVLAVLPELLTDDEAVKAARMAMIARDECLELRTDALRAGLVAAALALTEDPT
jgi:hypothetical protein